MTTLDLRSKAITVDELLQLASADSVMVISRDGDSYVVETADAFEREAAELGSSESFMAFLAERAREPGSVSIEDIERRLSETKSK